ncbi:hypothetical protein GCM10009837_12790 [Streptomyces durmitorensis]|uniref:DUF937 domain-containing protein n=1 Tax=Streptomyces durmitorensis TaxID=319947 RepID=A0ABY4PZR3_9ACTN|nr:DUF937 domain-containing protein [Streptomyces durmitorensis]UQT58452.1 DUF937 domain-containing protein [Streptomyces durmitorensis]
MSEESSETAPGTSLEKDVLDELGDDKLQEIAGLLGTDAAGAQDVVGTTVTALSGNLQEKAEDPAEAEEVQQAFAEAAPPQGIAGFGGFGGLAAGGMLSGVLAKMSRPVANAVAKKTGLPAASVTRVIELLIPVLLTVLTKRASASKPTGGGGGGLGDLLGQILGGKRK